MYTFQSKKILKTWEQLKSELRKVSAFFPTSKHEGYQET